MVASLVLELVDTDLGALGVPEHLTGHRDLGQCLRIGGDGGAVDNQSHRQGHLLPLLGFQLFDLDHISDSDFVLLAAGLDDCVGRHHCSCLFILPLHALRFARGPAAGRVLGLGRAPTTDPASSPAVSLATTGQGYVTCNYGVKPAGPQRDRRQHTKVRR
ncbi:Uncharacterised protein [Mycobacterium tuberculosis]|nr:Uncharacterised protein [Mycobacterium tuberculosis]